MSAISRKPLHLLVLPHVALLATAVALAGCQSDAEDGSNQQESQVQGGSNDTNAAHNFAVGVANRYGGVCSGTLIAPNLVLTARHCVVPPSSDDVGHVLGHLPGERRRRARSTITTEPNLYKAKSYYAATEIITPSDKAFCGNDIALIVLEKNVPATEAQPAIAGRAVQDDGQAPQRQHHGDGLRHHEPVRRGLGRSAASARTSRSSASPAARTWTAAATWRSTRTTPPSSSPKATSARATPAAARSTRGRSTRGSPYVLGTLSRGPQTKDKCLAAIYSRTDAHAQLIVDAAKKAAAQGNYEPPTWTVPESPSGASDPAADPAPTTTDPAAPPSTSTMVTSGCSASPRGVGSRGGMAGLVGLVVAAVLASRRRRVA